MSPEAQRVAIAEACGAKWHYVPPKEGYAYRPKRILSFFSWEFDSPHCAPLPFPDKFGDATCIPDYLNDLNAMRGALSILRPDDAYYSQQDMFIMELLRICSNKNRDQDDQVHLSGCFHLATATPAQQAEAFLRTLELWDDTK